MGERGDFGAHVVGTYTYRIICVVKKHACDEHELVIISSRARRRGLCCRSNRFPPTWSLTMRYTIITIIITLYIYTFAYTYVLSRIIYYVRVRFTTTNAVVRVVYTLTRLPYYIYL